MALLSPGDVLREVADALPVECKPNVIIVGSLAAAYHFFEKSGNQLRTKDVDCMFSPHAKAVAVAREVTEKLLKENWTLRSFDPSWATPGDSSTPTDKLPLVRLNPPSNKTWFIELMGIPEDSFDGIQAKTLVRMNTSKGDYALHSFGYLGLAEWQSRMTPHGIRYAIPEMMALANLLHHPTLGPATIAGERIGSTPIKRCNKDLGRVLALAYLTETEELGRWAALWYQALTEKYATRADHLAATVGPGLEALLKSPEDLDQATHTCALGLLSSMDVSSAALAATGMRFLDEVITPVKKMGRAPSPQQLWP